MTLAMLSIDATDQNGARPELSVACARSPSPGVEGEKGKLGEKGIWAYSVPINASPNPIVSYDAVMSDVVAAEPVLISGGEAAQTKQLVGRLGRHANSGKTSDRKIAPCW